MSCPWRSRRGKGFILYYTHTREAETTAAAAAAEKRLDLNICFAGHPGWSRICCVYIGLIGRKMRARGPADWLAGLAGWSVVRASHVC